jgi:hypothetical protein
LWLIQRASTLQHDSLTVPANVGDELDTMGRSHQGAPARFLGQGMVVPDFGHGQLMTHIFGALLKNGFQLTLEQRII